MFKLIQATQTNKSKLMAHPMTQVEWCAALLRADDYEGGWIMYLANKEKHGFYKRKRHAY